MNEAIIDAAVMWEEYDNKNDGGMPVLECPECERESFIYVKVENSA